MSYSPHLSSTSHEKSGKREDHFHSFLMVEKNIDFSPIDVKVRRIPGTFCRNLVLTICSYGVYRPKYSIKKELILE